MQKAKSLRAVSQEYSTQDSLAEYRGLTGDELRERVNHEMSLRHGVHRPPSSKPAARPIKLTFSMTSEYLNGVYPLPGSPRELSPADFGTGYTREFYERYEDPERPATPQPWNMNAFRGIERDFTPDPVLGSPMKGMQTFPEGQYNVKTPERSTTPLPEDREQAEPTPEPVRPKKLRLHIPLPEAIEQVESTGGPAPGSPMKDITPTPQVVAAAPLAMVEPAVASESSMKAMEATPDTHPVPPPVPVLRRSQRSAVVKSPAKQPAPRLADETPATSTQTTADTYNVPGPSVLESPLRRSQRTCIVKSASISTQNRSVSKSRSPRKAKSAVNPVKGTRDFSEGSSSGDSATAFTKYRNIPEDDD